MQSHFYKIISKEKVKYLTCLVVILGVFANDISVLAQVETNNEVTNGAVEYLQSKIQEKNKAIESIEKDIKVFQGLLQQTGNEKASLQNTISDLDLTSKKLTAESKLTEAKIDKANLDLQSLGGKIRDASEDIDSGTESLRAIMRRVHEQDESPIVETLLGSKTLAEAFVSDEYYARTFSGVKNGISLINDSKKRFENSHSAVSNKKKELLELRTALANQKKVIQVTATEKQALLAQTKNKEANYASLLAEKQANKEAFEREIYNYEAAIKIAIDPSKLPTPGTASLVWPLSSVAITQYFGDTAFSKTQSIYNGRGHNGIDLRASIGTPVLAAQDGVVAGTGNTGVLRSCVSYGKWIMLRHPNGLSTLYAHLSLIDVVPGQQVRAGQTIAYSGNTGYTTGPHLHFGVYATQGIEIKPLTNSVNCRNIIIPVADFKAYLNPLSYLPKI